MNKIMRAYLQSFLMILASLIVSWLFKIDLFVLLAATIIFQLSVLQHEVYSIFTEKD